MAITMASAGPLPEVDPAPTTTTILMEQVFGRRNLPYVPPHLQRAMLSQKMSNDDTELCQTAKNPPVALFTKRQAKPRGRSNFFPPSRMA